MKQEKKQEIEQEKIVASLYSLAQTEQDYFVIEFSESEEKMERLLEHQAQIPIPPYIRGGVADEQDRRDYQTVYADKEGSVAAPTAGLHFTKDLIDKLQNSGIDHSFVTLHVGLGTFRPVKSASILDHKMHRECYEVLLDEWIKIKEHAENLIAVGTTSLRVLETIDLSEQRSESLQGFTDLFLYPGKKVTKIRGLITNFHLPQSSLLMLVSSLIGREKTLELYQEAIKERYRFFSYGDAMLILL